MKQKLLFMYYQILGKLAKKYLAKHKSYIIGIHGSVGKTSCRAIIYQTLKHFLPNKKIYSSPKNFNGELGMSLSIFQIEHSSPNIFNFIKNLYIAFSKTYFGTKAYDIILLEYGIDRPKEMAFLLNIVKPHIGIVTKLDSVHSMQFGSPEAIAQEEIKMLKNTLETVFINEEEPYAMQIKDDLLVETFIYQSAAKHNNKSSHADIKSQEKNIIWDDKNTENNLQSHIQVSIKNKHYNLTTNLLGHIHYAYISLGLTIADILHYKFYQEELHEDIFESLTLNYELLPGRFNFFKGINDSIILDSTYNSAPLSARKIIDTAYETQKKLFKDKEIWLFLGEMRELGAESKQEHEAFAEYIAAKNPKKLFLVGSDMKNYFMPKLKETKYNLDNVFYADKSTELSLKIKKLLEKNEHNKSSVFLVAKGSQNTIFLEEGIKTLLADKSDSINLCRQSNRRLKKKQEFLD